MANRRETSSAGIHFSVFVETSLCTRLGILVHSDESIPDFKERLCNEHNQCFPELGQIKINTLKIKHQDHFYHLSNSIDLRNFLDGISQSCFIIYVDAARVETARRKRKKKQKRNISSANTLLAAIENDNLPANLLEANSGPCTEKNKKQKSSVQRFSRKRPAMWNGDHDNRSKISKTLSKDHIDATESKGSPSKCLETAYPSKNVVSAPPAVEVNCDALEETLPIKNAKETDALFTPVKKDTESGASRIELADNTEDDSISKQILKEKADIVGGGAKSEKEKKSLDLHPGGSIDRVQRVKNDGSGSLKVAVKKSLDLLPRGSMKPKEIKARVQPASSGAKSVRSGSVKVAVKEAKTSHVSSKSPWDSVLDDCSSEDGSSDDGSSDDGSSDDGSSDHDSDVSFMSRKQGNNLAGGTNRLSGSLVDMLRSSRSYKKAYAAVAAYHAQEVQVISDDESPANKAK